MRAGFLEGHRFGVPVDQVGHEEAAEEHDLGNEEHPHPEGRGLGLLGHVIEVMLELRMNRVRRVFLARLPGPHRGVVNRPGIMLGV